MTVMYIAGGALVGLVVLMALMAVVGAFLPRRHVATRRARIGRPREALWRDLTDVAAFPSWRGDLRRVELAGEGRWREIGKHGAILMELAEQAPPGRLVVRIADPALPFGGAWTFVLEPDGDGTIVTITEDGEVKNPIFRFLSKVVFSLTATLDAYLVNLAKKHGERVTPEGVA
jgi:uncharacterized protein YndB with AHSA1/START domain